MSTYSTRPPYLRPKWMLLGFAGTFIALAFFAHRLGHKTFHHDFVRFTQMESPETRYYPSLEEYLAIVRSRCEKDQVLVLVGGNSILYGVGQPAEQVWTKHLQDDLGPDYCVLNFALRGGTIADGAAIVSEVLRDEYPRQILVANAAPIQSADPIGGAEPFRYLVKNAWDRGLLLNHPSREARFDAHWKQNRWSLERGYNLLDGAVRFRTFGNYITWQHYSFVPNMMLPLPHALHPRSSFGDPEPDMSKQPIEVRYNPKAFDIEMEITRGFSVLTLQKDEAGEWTPSVKRLEDFATLSEKLRPPELRKNTLIITASNSPYYLQHLTPDELKRDATARTLSVKLWEDAGYAAIDYGDGFTADDFADRTHLTTSGGIKLSKRVAAKVKEMTKHITYE